MAHLHARFRRSFVGPADVRNLRPSGARTPASSWRSYFSYESTFLLLVAMASNLVAMTSNLGEIWCQELSAAPTETGCHAAATLLGS